MQKMSDGIDHLPYDILREIDKKQEHPIIENGLAANPLILNATTHLMYQKILKNTLPEEQARATGVNPALHLSLLRRNIDGINPALHNTADVIAGRINQAIEQKLQNYGLGEKEKSYSPA